MKKIFIVLLMLFGFAQLTPALASAAAKNAEQGLSDKLQKQQNALPSSLSNMSAEEFLNLTPKKIKAETGKKLKLKEKIALKLAQKAMKKQAKSEGRAGSGIDKTVYIILAIFIPFLAVGLATDWKGNDWWICLLLTFCFWIPGIIFAFIKMGDYY